MKKRAKLEFLALLISGGIIGNLLAPSLNISREVGMLAGAVLGLLLGFTAIPGLAQSMQQPSDDRRTPSFISYLTHPTQLPMTLATFWLFGLLALWPLIERMIGAMPAAIQQTLFGLIWLMPAFFGMGLSGLQMALRGEYARPGIVIRGEWAMLQGILFMLFGWGVGILLALILIPRLK